MLVVDGKPYGLRMEHCWVEAQLNYDIDLGKRNPVSKDTTWIPMDASYKILEYNDPVKLEEQVPLNVDSLLEEIRASAIIDTITGAVTGMDTTIINQTLEDYSTNLKNWTDENLGDSATIGEVFPFKWIKPKESGGFSPVLPYQVTRNIDKYPEVSENLRYKITIEVMSERNIGTDISYTFPTVGIVGKRILLAYAPASSNDEELLLSQVPDTLTDTTNIPSAISAYLINMKPQIIIENEAVATGSTIGMGKEQTYRLIFRSPTGLSDEVENSAIVGSMYGIGFNLSKVPTEVMKNRMGKYQEVKEQIEAQNIPSLTSYDIVGELLAFTSNLYYYRLDMYNELFSRKMEVFRQRVPSEAITSLSLEVTSLLGIPYSLSANGFRIDVDRDMETVFGKDGDKGKKKSYNLESGMMGSEMEARILEQTFRVRNVKALSATRILSIANEQQIPIYTINSSNIFQITPLLNISEKMIPIIECAVNRGLEVIIPGSNIQYNGWEGIGYIAINPETGEGAYMVEGIGGGGIWYFLWWVVYVALWLIVAVCAVKLALLLLAFFIPIIEGIIAGSLIMLNSGNYHAASLIILDGIKTVMLTVHVHWPGVYVGIVEATVALSQFLEIWIPGIAPAVDNPYAVLWCIKSFIEGFLGVCEEIEE